MMRILVTAFEPYDDWTENSSWLALVEFTKHLSSSSQVVTRRYPVDFGEVRSRLEADLRTGFDYAIHLGQAPGSAQIRLEAVALNIGRSSHDPAAVYRFLTPDGPMAYHSQLPLAKWSQSLRQTGIPVALSFHAGTYLCNAVLYLTHYLSDKHGLPTQATFVHLPLDVSQVAIGTAETPCLPAHVGASAVTQIVRDLLTREPVAPPELV